jgi:hypothetical protein
MQAKTHPRQRRLIGLISLGGIIGALLYSAPLNASEATTGMAPFRAFSGKSYWNTALPRAVRIGRRSDEIIEFLHSDNQGNFIRLAGTGESGRWGNPIYWSGTGDASYAVANSCGYRKQPREFRNVRIPAGAEPDPTSDAEMTIYDFGRGLVYGMHRASYDAEHDAWSACGGAVFTLDSNGLDGGWPGSDAVRNTGHRGIPPPTFAVRYDEILWGSIDHVLKIAVNSASPDHVFPMVGSDGVSADPSAPPEGARLRIKPTVDLTEFGLSPAALVIAQALQRYGAVVGDQSGSSVVIKVENTVAEGRGYLWSGVLTANSLATIPLDAYEVVKLGYRG